MIGQLTKILEITCYWVLDENRLEKTVKKVSFIECWICSFSLVLDTACHATIASACFDKRPEFFLGLVFNEAVKSLT